VSRHDFDPNCPDCRPAILDINTGRPLPQNHPTMVAVNALWDDLPFEDQEALHRIWVKNSRDPADLEVAERFTEAFQRRTSN
jgi:hypothetical protein